MYFKWQDQEMKRIIDLGDSDNNNNHCSDDIYVIYYLNYGEYLIAE